MMDPAEQDHQAVSFPTTRGAHDEDDDHDNDISSSSSTTTTTTSPHHHHHQPIIDDRTVLYDDDGSSRHDDHDDDRRGSSATARSAGLTTTTVQIDAGTTVRPRNYQVEMLERSLTRNVIVAIETGGGKTHIAIMRIQAELERMQPGQPPSRIWFLAPTVTLCRQQHVAIASRLPGVQVKLLSGADDVDHWSTQAIWDAVLLNVRVVVSTYQILLDAMAHAFVTLSDLALLVIDEAHNCVRNHAGRQIMQRFYHPRKQAALPVPCILGLTASPVMKRRAQEVDQIEATLDAVCVVPKRHRAELAAFVNRPLLDRVYFAPPDGALGVIMTTPLLSTLSAIYSSLDLNTDPYVQFLKSEDTPANQRKLLKVFRTGSTYCHDQIKTLLGNAEAIFEELGPWCADYYISTVVAKVREDASSTITVLTSWDDDGLSQKESIYLDMVLGGLDHQVAVPWCEDMWEDLVTDKLAKLVHCIQRRPRSMTAIIFVERRAMVAVLHKFLSMHPDTRQHRYGTMVGTSDSSHRIKSVTDLLRADEQEDTMRMFKEGSINIVIATSVLEEGIDVAACNTVLCFTAPKNLKSFVQRRGRARQRDSSLVLLLPNDEVSPIDWEALERDMREIYEDEMRLVQELIEIEADDDAEVDHEIEPFIVPDTGAELNMDGATAHLYHFCSTLSSNHFIEHAPDFTCFETDDGLNRASVTLPIFVHESLRRHQSRHAWRSEKNAIKDAAFQAYVSLYHAGLVNDHLLPLKGDDAEVQELRAGQTDKRAALVDVRELVDVWGDVARKWKEEIRIIRVIPLRIGDVQVKMMLPLDLPPIPPLELYWVRGDTVTVVFDTQDAVIASSDSLNGAQADTQRVMKAAFRHRFRIDTDNFIVPIKIARDSAEQSAGPSLVRDRLQGTPYIYVATLSCKPPLETVQYPFLGYEDAAEDAAYHSLQTWPKRCDFYHSPPKQEVSRKQHAVVLPVHACTLDTEATWQEARIALLLPSIMHYVELYILAARLSTTLLRDVAIPNLNHLITAISASSAQERQNYQRLEFVGDAALKICTSIELIDAHALWPEGYLSAKKDRLVSNTSLFNAAIRIGLDRFIVTKQFTGRHWRHDVDQSSTTSGASDSRQLSSKIPADVVEALIGVAMVDGGFPKAHELLRIILPELQWLDLEARRASLYSKAADDADHPHLESLEEMLGYTFRKKSLLTEAVTHASCHTGRASYERLEFLGDAILDHIVVTALRAHAQLSHVQLHGLRAALVNADLLAFLSMELCVERERNDAVTHRSRTSSRSAGPAEVTCEQVRWTASVPLYSFMRHHSQRLAERQLEVAARHGRLREGLLHALRSGNRYPWADLATLGADKCYSDMVESLLGAMWIDSPHGFDACTALLERLGLLPLLRRFLVDLDHVEILHPKEAIGHLAVSAAVTYQLDYIEAGGGSPRSAPHPLSSSQGQAGYTCRLLVGDREIVHVTGATSKIEAQVRAATAAVDIVRAEVCADGDGDGGVDVDVEE